MDFVLQDNMRARIASLVGRRKNIWLFVSCKDFLFVYILLAKNFDKLSQLS